MGKICESRRFLWAHFGDLPEDFAMRLQVWAFAMVKNFITQVHSVVVQECRG